MKNRTKKLINQYSAEKSRGLPALTGDARCLTAPAKPAASPDGTRLAQSIYPFQLSMSVSSPDF